MRSKEDLHLKGPAVKKKTSSDPRHVCWIQASTTLYSAQALHQAVAAVAALARALLHARADPCSGAAACDLEAAAAAAVAEGAAGAAIKAAADEEVEGELDAAPGDGDAAVAAALHAVQAACRGGDSPEGREEAAGAADADAGVLQMLAELSGDAGVMQVGAGGTSVHPCVCVCCTWPRLQGFCAHAFCQASAQPPLVETPWAQSVKCCLCHCDGWGREGVGERCGGR